jgi:glycosyltransferase involved in cell wall biosynthesis
LAINKPVLVPRTQGIGDYFQEDEILYFTPGDLDDLTARIEWAAGHPAELGQLMERGRRVYVAHSWEREEAKFLELAGRLTAGKAASQPGNKP